MMTSDASDVPSSAPVSQPSLAFEAERSGAFEVAPPIPPETFVDDMFADDDQAERWRRVLLALSEELRGAADARPELSSVLMEAMHHALERLLLYGEPHSLICLEEWLSHESSAPETIATVPQQDDPNFVERRALTDRRAKSERRAGDDRRSNLGRREQERGSGQVRAWVHQSASGLWIAEVPQLPGCASAGVTQDDALRALQTAVSKRLHSGISQGEATFFVLCN